jgi:hypothetical protein
MVADGRHTCRAIRHLRLAEKFDKLPCAGYAPGGALKIAPTR